MMLGLSLSLAEMNFRLVQSGAVERGASGKPDDDDDCRFPRENIGRKVDLLNKGVTL